MPDMKIDYLRCSLDKAATQLLWDFGSRSDLSEDLVGRLRQRYSGNLLRAVVFPTPTSRRDSERRPSLRRLGVSSPNHRDDRINCEGRLNLGPSSGYPNNLSVKHPTVLGITYGG